MIHVCNKNNLKLERIDYNEACDGKDECDRKFSLLKRAMRYYRDEGKDILSANDMMNAILNRCNNQNIKCQVISINNSSISNYTKIAGITNIHSVKIEPEGIRVWNFYEIGEGKLLQTRPIQFRAAVETLRPFENVKILRSLTSPLSSHHFTMNNSFVCEECNTAFNDEISFEQHVLEELSGSKSNWDQAINLYKDHTKTLKQRSLVPILNEIRSEVYEDTFIKSWAIKTVKRERFSSNQKAFMERCFNNGVKTGKSHFGRVQQV